MYTKTNKDKGQAECHTDLPPTGPNDPIQPNPAKPEPPPLPPDEPLPQPVEEPGPPPMPAGDPPPNEPPRLA